MINAFLDRCSMGAIAAGAPDLVPYGNLAAHSAGCRVDCILVETMPQHLAAWAHVIATARPDLPLLIHAPASAGNVWLN